MPCVGFAPIQLHGRGIEGVDGDVVAVDVGCGTGFHRVQEEVEGRVRKAVAVVKNRGGDHEDSIRELWISNRGLHIGEVLKSFSNLLSGEPRFTGDGQTLLDDQDLPDA